MVACVEFRYRFVLVLIIGLKIWQRFFHARFGIKNLQNMKHTITCPTLANESSFDQNLSRKLRKYDGAPRTDIHFTPIKDAQNCSVEDLLWKSKYGHPSDNFNGCRKCMVTDVPPRTQIAVGPDHRGISLHRVVYSP